VRDTDEHGYENCVISVISDTLAAWLTILETHREPQRKFDSAVDHFLRVTEVGVDENLEAVCTEVEELLAFILLLFFGQSVLGLRDLKLSTSVQSHETHAEVSSAWTLLRSMIGDTDMKWAHQGQVPDIRQSLDHLATQIRKLGSWAALNEPPKREQSCRRSKPWYDKLIRAHHSLAGTLQADLQRLGKRVNDHPHPLRS
jgi:hypothetical protein